MRFPRFTTLQLLLAAALCALVLGLATATWRASGYTQVVALRYSPSGKYVVASYITGSNRVWNVQQNPPRLVRQLMSSPWAYDSDGQAYFLDDDTLLDIQRQATRDVVRTIDISSGLAEEHFSFPASRGLYAAAGDTLAVADWSSGAVDCYSIREGRRTTTIKPAGATAYGLSVSRDGKTLVLPDQKGFIHVYDIPSGQKVESQAATGVTSAVLSPDGRWLAHVGWPQPGEGNSIYLADLHRSSQPEVLETTIGYPAWVAFTGDSTRIAAAGYDAAELYDVATSERLGRIVFDDPRSGPWNPISAVWRSGGGLSQFALAPDGQTLATFDGSRVILWDMRSGAKRLRLGHTRWPQILIFAGGFVGWAIAWGVVARRQLPQAALYPQPIELKLIWGLLFIGGLAAVAFPVALLLINGPLLWPGVYYALGIGLVLIVVAAGRRAARLQRVAALQLFSLLACDPVNFVLGLIVQTLLRRPHVQSYLQHVNSASAAASTAAPS